MTQKAQRDSARSERKPPIGHEIVRPDGSVIRYVRVDGDGQHYRTVDTLALMLRNGTITGAMYDAGQHFSLDFAMAFASGVASPKLDGLPRGTAPGQMMIERHAGAARAVRAALAAVGGGDSPAGSALWFVAGLGMSVREWALREGWAGRVMSKEEGKGILIAGLGMLARHYGYAPRERKSEKKSPDEAKPA